MMKILLNIVFLFVIFTGAKAQVPDSLHVNKDSLEKAKYNLPVLSDTTQYLDTSIIKTKSGKDSVVVKKKVHSPRKATRRSLIIPGWGQIYNKKYWKVPIVYAGIGIPAYLFVYNKNWYNKTRYALSIVANDRYTEDSLSKVDPQLRYLVDTHSEGSLVNYRNEFRRSMDYSILFVILMWGLNVVDATVDAHLKGFDVGDELSLKIKPALMNNSLSPGISFVVNFK